MYDFSLNVLKPASEQLLLTLRANRGARIGEASVISCQVHTYDPSSPEVVQVLLNADAGQIFYHRQDSGKIFHVDVFHECGLVDPVLAAETIKAAIEIFHVQCRDDRDISDFYINPDWIDIQTGSGGGRITGKLSYGKKTSLCKAHENHVHLTIMTPFEQLMGLFYVINAVERAILASNLELRRNEEIIYIDNDQNSKIDFSQFVTQTDSLLRDDSEILLSQHKANCIDDEKEDKKTFLDNSYVVNHEIRPCNSFQGMRQHHMLPTQQNNVSSDDQILVEMNEQGIMKCTPKVRQYDILK